MGMSASADLGFGVMLPDDRHLVSWDREYGISEELEEQLDYAGELDAYDMDEILAVRQLVAENALTGGYEDDYGAMSARREVIREEVGKYGKDAPVEVMSGGTYEYSQDALVLRDKRFRAHTYWGGEAVSFDTPSEADIAAAVEFCKKYNLPDFSQAAWILTAHYG